MFVITEKQEKYILDIGEKVDYLSNGYPRIVEKNRAYPTNFADVYEIDSLPEDTAIIEKYCYTPEKGFYLNPNWVEPDPGNIWNVPDEVYRHIKDAAIQEVQDELNK